MVGTYEPMYWEYLSDLAHLFHLTPSDVRILTVREFWYFRTGIDRYRADVGKGQ